MPLPTSPYIYLMVTTHLHFWVIHITYSSVVHLIPSRDVHGITCSSPCTFTYSYSSDNYSSTANKLALTPPPVVALPRTVAPLPLITFPLVIALQLVIAFLPVFTPLILQLSITLPLIVILTPLVTCVHGKQQQLVLIIVEHRLLSHLFLKNYTVSIIYRLAACVNIYLTIEIIFAPRKKHLSTSDF